MSTKLKSKIINFPVRVYYEDTDIAGIVYYANYLKFAERARTEALRIANINQSELLEKHDTGFVVKNCVIDFIAPARFDDLLTVETELISMKKASLKMLQTIKKKYNNKSEKEEILVTLEIKLAVVGKNMKITKIPDSIQKAILDIFITKNQ
ncbi:MAG: tol-pal system-associated acyl-CoA thioesterase [Rickettsiales bacterium]